MTRRPVLWGVGIGLALLALGVWSVVEFTGARAAAIDAARDLQACRATAARIDRLHRLVAAGSTRVDQTDLQRRGQEALQAVGLTPEHLLQIAPDKPRSVGQSAYKQVPTEIVLRDVDLRQLVGFLLAMEGKDSFLRVQNLRLFAPHDAVSGARWSVEATVSYLIYEPPATIRVVRNLKKD